MARQPFVPAELTGGPFTFVEAQRAGLTRRQLQGASWRRVGVGLYVWAGLTERPALVLATVLRRLPATAAFSGRTAAWLHGLDLPPCDPIDVTIPTGCGVSARSGVSVHRARLRDGDVVERRGMPATSVLRTLLDLCRRSPLMEAMVAVDTSLRKGLLDLAELRAQPGLGRAAELAEPKAESAMETRLRLLLVLAGLPRPEAQVPLHDANGRFVGRPDLYYRTHRLGLEYDGGTHRNSLVQDDRRQNRLLSAGYRLLRFTAADVHRAPDSVVAQVRGALAAPHIFSTT